MELSHLDITIGCDLKLTQQQAVEVAMGIIDNWKELGCDDQKLTWAHRSDGSGTTKAFTNSMQAFSETWTLGTGKSVAWPLELVVRVTQELQE